MNNSKSNFEKGSYGYDVAFIAGKHIQTIELKDEQSKARIMLVPGFQGRVMTSSAGGNEGLSFGWINYKLIESGKVSKQFNPYGGEERIWLGPEGGPFSIYFPKGKEQIYANWVVPKEIDTEPFDVESQTQGSVSFQKEFALPKLLIASYADWTGPFPVIRQIPLKNGKPERAFMESDALWGTQWNLNILWSLVYPEYGNRMAETFLDFYRNAGMMSRSSWGGNYSYVMVGGDQVVPLLAVLMSTGRATFNYEIAYAAARKNAFPGGIRDRAGYDAGPSPQGGGIDLYIELGYVPVEIELGPKPNKKWKTKDSFKKV